eukprot:GHVH01005507.1.p1 GENE.GHVH01005507.1~~GHVH01005507.1.p1  ORF type:complete len:215 (+),score=47.88 GHVH01005507.1:108-752(+)
MAKLKLKGDHQKGFEQLKKLEKKKKKREAAAAADENKDNNGEEGGGSAATSHLPRRGERVEGLGRIVTTEDEVYGFETSFQDELEVGDVIIVLMQSSAVKEEKVVEKILSNRSCKISTPFSSNLTGQTHYIIQKDAALMRKKAELEAKRTGTDINDMMSKVIETKLNNSKANSVTYREKLNWGYRSVTEKTSAPLSAEERLNTRISKQGRDKFC